MNLKSGKMGIVKVCGMRDPENIRQLGLIKQVDFMGLIFHQDSPRFVNVPPSFIQQAPHIKRIGVFVNKNYSEIVRTAGRFELNLIQLHGDEDPELCARLAERFQVIKAFRIDEDFDFSILDDYAPHCKYFLFDADAAGDEFDGNNTKFNWDILKRYDIPVPFLLSGGIGPDDLELLQDFEHPDCVGINLNSGFEIEPAIKDIGKLSGFLNQLVCPTV